MTNNSKILAVIGFVGLALAGLIGVQVYWVNRTYDLSEKEFSANAKEALEETVRQINNSLVCYEVFTKVHINPKEGFYLLKNKWENNLFVNSRQPDTIPMYYNDTRFNVDFRWNKIMFTRHVNVSMILQFSYTPEGKDSSKTYANSFEKATLENYQDYLSEQKPPEKIYNPLLFDSLLKINLANKSITETCYFAYLDRQKNKTVYAHNQLPVEPLTEISFRTKLTPTEYFSRPYDVSLTFNNHKGLILSGFRKLLLLSIAIVIILMGAFIVFVRLILKQRRLSQLKSDFINNMTHEFKTPLTNISLAVESLTEQKMVTDKKGEQMIKIVALESERLRENIERILQIARYEKEKLHLAIERIDINQLIKKVTDVFELNNDSEIVFHLQFNAKNNFQNVDEVHFFNLLYNLIDNSIKYNNNKPEIEITTKDQLNGISILVKDNGIGISATNQKRLFEKFYRVQQGNLHDIKGYGLGLSYAKLVVESHNGTIKVTSQPGRGSEFEIFIPFKS